MPFKKYVQFGRGRHWLCHRELLPEWITPVVCIALFLFLEFKHPFERDFSLNDLEISHKMAAHERVPIWLLAILALCVPIGTFFVGSYISNKRQYYFILIHVSILAFAVSLTFTGFVTNFLKVLIGRPRPDFLDRCQPKEGTPTDVLVDTSVCTNTDTAVVLEGFKSLPSGHSSIAFGSFFFLSLWMAGQLGVFSKSPLFISNGNGVKGLVCTAPILFATYVGISRTEDYRHRGSDVIAGSLIGIAIAWVSYRLFFPALASDDCDTPYILISLSEYESEENYVSQFDDADLEAGVGHEGILPTNYRSASQNSANINSALSGPPPGQGPVFRTSSRSPLVPSIDTGVQSPTTTSSTIPMYSKNLSSRGNLEYPTSGPSSSQPTGAYEMRQSPLSSARPSSQQNYREEEESTRF